jgi:MscS family membrane protein
MLPENVYLRALTVFVIYFILAEVVLYISGNVILKITHKTKTKVDDLIVKSSMKPISLIIILAGVRIAAAIIGLDETTSLAVQKTVSSVVVLIGMWIALSIVKILINNWGVTWAKRTKSTVDDNLMKLLHKATKLLVLVVGVLFLLDVWGVNITPMLASLGIAGIAVAFAMQSTLANVFGGMSLIIDRSLKVGDVVELDADTIGNVMDIGIRSTKIRTFDNELIIVPNGKLADMRIKNYVQPDESARLVVPFNVAYGSDIDKVKKLIMSEIRKVKEVSKEPEPLIRFIEMADSALSFKVYMWLEDYRERFLVKDIINTKIYNALNKAGISIPFPQMEVHLKKK